MGAGKVNRVPRNELTPKMNIGLWIIVALTSIVLGWAILFGSELLQLACWKLKRCPKCSKKYAFPGWDWAEWQNEYFFSIKELDDFPEDGYSRGVVCPHCGSDIRTGRSKTL
jgi:hypothetical protein